MRKRQRMTMRSLVVLSVRSFLMEICFILLLSIILLLFLSSKLENYDNKSELEASGNEVTLYRALMRRQVMMERRGQGISFRKKL